MVLKVKRCLCEEKVKMLLSFGSALKKPKRPPHVIKKTNMCLFTIKLLPIETQSNIVPMSKSFYSEGKGKKEEFSQNLV